MSAKYYNILHMLAEDTDSNISTVIAVARTTVGASCIYSRMIRDAPLGIAAPQVSTISIPTRNHKVLTLDRDVGALEGYRGE